MTDTSVVTPAPVTPTPTPLPNDPAARSPTGEILEPSQIQPTAAEIAAAKRNPETPAKPDGAPDGTSTPKADAKDPAKAPDAYADFTAPDGYTLDKTTIDAFAPIAKELGLTQDQAQRLVTFHSERMIAAAKAPTDAFESTRNEWRGKVDADPDLKAATSGGKTGLEAVKLDIGKVFNALGDPALVADFKEAMNLTGVGDHPAFVKALWKLSSFLAEGTHVAGAQPSPHGQRQPGTSERPSPAKALYPGLA